jgi:DNA repair exonuclease SbcCD ATPase subunit
MIKGMRITNWQRFKGEHEIELGAGVTSITARHTDNPARSNWLGKSTLLWAIRFALFGEVPTETLDDAISHGEPELAVDLELIDGFFVSRSRKRGKSTDLMVSTPDGRELFGGQAQETICEHIGMGSEDFERTAWIGQKQIHRFVTATPSERSQIVSEWLALDRVDQASAKARAKASQFEREIGATRARLDELPAPFDLDAKRAELAGVKREQAAAQANARAWEVYREACARRDRAVQAVDFFKQEIAGLGAPLDCEGKRAELTALHARVEAVRATEREARRVREANADRLVLADKHVRRDEARRQVEILRGQLDGMGNGDASAFESEVETAAGDVAKLVRDHFNASKLARGDWDGHCPIACEQCTVAGAVRKQLAQHVERVRLIGVDLEASRLRHSNAVAVVAKLRQTRDARLKLEARLEDAKRAANLALHDLPAELPLVEVPDATPAIRAAAEIEADLARAARVEMKRAEYTRRLEVAQADLARAEEDCVAQPPDTTVDLHALAATAARLQAEINAATAVTARREELRAKLDADTAELGVYRAAAVILGRAGVQRVVAQRAIAEIEASANERLACSGIDLSIALVYGKELSGLADVCEACGEPFPKSQRVKGCAVCGATRGPKRDDKLHATLSSRSGAADDLAGYALQTAATAWLRRYRGTAWNVCIADEPMASLDEEHRGQLARAILSMARADRSQVLIVSHDSAIREMFPNRIEIVSDDKWSRVEV